MARCGRTSFKDGLLALFRSIGMGDVSGTFVGLYRQQVESGFPEKDGSWDDETIKEPTVSPNMSTSASYNERETYASEGGRIELLRPIGAVQLTSLY
jgi:hypothetical protein